MIGKTNKYTFIITNFFKSFHRLLEVCARLMPMTLTGISNGYKMKFFKKLEADIQ
jgi:hypothetical protein